MSKRQQRKFYMVLNVFEGREYMATWELIQKLASSGDDDEDEKNQEKSEVGARKFTLQDG